MDTSESWLNPCLPTNPDSNPDMESQQNYVSLKPTCSTVVLKSPSTSVLNLGEQKVIKTLRPHSTPATLMWLEENYEIADGICIPRSTLYMHYVDFCDRNGMQPVNAASFGKIIRQQFPQLTTRRLGTRGQSRYHYYGIAVRETSAYYDVTFSKQGLNNTGEIKRETNRQVSPYNPKSKMVSLLPDFPSTKHLHLPSNTGEERVATFLMMYHTHCQRIMDTIIRASFDEVQSFLLHFWQGMPPHINSVLGTNVIVNIVGVCDSILYRAISNVLLPSVLQPVPDSLTQVIRKFSKDLESWIRIALEDLPENLVTVKYDLARRFSQMLRRQTSLNHLSQASRMVLHNVDITSQMLHDWRNVDQDSICRQTIYTMDQTYNSHTLQLIRCLYREFEVLLEEQSSMQAYIDWLETMVDRCVVQPSRKHKNSLRRISRQFLLMWSAFGTRVIRDMTLHSAPSFGSFHLLHLTFDDYVLYLVETLYADERMRELYANIATDSPPSFSDLEETFGDPDGNMNKVKWYNTPNSDPSEHLITSNTAVVLGTNSTRTNTEIIGPPTPTPNPETAADSTTCVMTDATNDAAAGNPNIMTEFTPVNEHYATMYPPYANSYDSRNGYRMTSRNYPYQTNQYILPPQNNGAADVPTREGSPRNSELPINGIDYSNTYISYRRPEYGSYGYEQSSPTSTVIYPPHCGNSSYYTSYETTGYGTRCKIKDSESNKDINVVENVDHEEKTDESVVAMPSYNSANNYVRV